MDMVLSKTDMGIAASYSELVEDVALRDSIFNAIKQEREETIKMLFAVTGNNRWLGCKSIVPRSKGCRAA